MSGNDLNQGRLGGSGQRSELAKVSREIDRFVQAILDGVPGSCVKEKMAALDARKVELEVLLARQI